MKKFSLGQLLDNKKFAMVFSLVIAIAAWFIVVTLFDTTKLFLVKDISVDQTVANTQLADLGLEVISVEPETVSVTVEGLQYKVPTLGNDDIHVSLSATDIATKVTEAGTYEIEIAAQKSTSDNDFSIIGVSQPTVLVTFDKYATKSISFSTDDNNIEVPNISVDSDYIRQSLVAEPDTLTIKGPEQEVDKISKWVMISEESKSINATTTIEAQLILYDSNGNVLDNSRFEFSRDESMFQITIVVYKQAEIELTFTYRNTPSNLNAENLKYTMSVKTIKVAGPAESVDNLNQINLGYIDVRELTIGKVFEFDIPIPSGFTSEEKSVTVTFDDSSWETSSDLSVTNIDFQNAPSDYKIELQSTGIKNISVVGDKSVVSQVTTEDLVATVNFSTITITEGTQTVPVTIEVYGIDGVWVVGAYECTVTAVKK